MAIFKSFTYLVIPTILLTLEPRTSLPSQPPTNYLFWKCQYKTVQFIPDSELKGGVSRFSIPLRLSVPSKPVCSVLYMTSRLHPLTLKLSIASIVLAPSFIASIRSISRIQVPTQMSFLFLMTSVLRLTSFIGQSLGD